MSSELIGILGVGAALLSVGVALGALILAGRRDTAQRLADMDGRLARVDGLLRGLGLSGRASPAAGRAHRVDLQPPLVQPRGPHEGWLFERGTAPLPGAPEGHQR